MNSIAGTTAKTEACDFALSSTVPPTSISYCRRGGLGLGILALVPKQSGKIGVIGRDARVLFTKRFLVDLRHPPKERLGLGMLALDPKQLGKIALPDRNGRVLPAESFLTDLNGAPIERLGLGKAREVCVRDRQIVQL